MAIKETIEGYSVIVFVPVREYGSVLRRMTAARALAEAKDIEDDIKRMIAKRRVYDTIDIEAQIHRACEYCGGHWTEGSRSYNGGCCDADEEAHAVAIAAATEG